MHIYATPPDLQTLTVSNSIKAMSAPIYATGDIAIAPPAIFVTIVAPIPNPEFTGWVYMALSKSDSCQYFCEEDLIKYDPNSLIVELKPTLKSCHIWAFHDAPTKYKKLSKFDGDEDWVIFMPTGFDEFTESCLVDRLTVCDFDSYEVDGGRVWITAHA